MFGMESGVSELIYKWKNKDLIFERTSSENMVLMYI